MKPSNNLENKTPSDTYWRIEKVQAHSSLEPPNDLFNHHWSYRNIVQFQIISRRENR